MTKDEVENGLTSPDLEIRRSFSENDEIFETLTEHQIERGLKDKHPLIRYIFAYKNISCHGKDDCSKAFTIEQQTRGLRDENPSVRALYIKNICLAEKDINFYLRDPSIEARVSLLRNLNVEFTDEQIRTLISTPIKRIIDCYIQRQCFIYSDVNFYSFRHKLKYKLIGTHSIKTNIPRYDEEHRLICQCASVRAPIGSSFNDYELKHMSYYQMERGLRDENSSVRHCFSSNNCLFYTENQTERGLNDENVEVRLAFVRNINLKLTHEQIIRVFKEDSSVVAKALSEREDFEFSPFQIELGLTSKYSSIRKHFAKSAPILTNEQIKHGLNDTSEQVVAAFINRDDSLEFISSEKIEHFLMSTSRYIKKSLIKKKCIDFTSTQTECLLTDEDDYIRWGFMQSANITLTEKQIDRGIREVRGEAVLALLMRDDIIFTSNQMEYLLNNTAGFLLERIKTRKEYIKYKNNLATSGKYSNKIKI